MTINYSAKTLIFYDLHLLFRVLNQGTGKKITIYLNLSKLERFTRFAALKHPGCFSLRI